MLNICITCAGVVRTNSHYDPRKSVFIALATSMSTDVRSCREEPLICCRYATDTVEHRCGVPIVDNLRVDELISMTDESFDNLL